MQATESGRAGLAVLVDVETVVSEQEMAFKLADRSGSLRDRILRLIEFGQMAPGTTDGEDGMIHSDTHDPLWMRQSPRAEDDVRESILHTAEVWLGVVHDDIGQPLSTRLLRVLDAYLARLLEAEAARDKLQAAADTDNEVLAAIRANGRPIGMTEKERADRLEVLLDRLAGAGVDARLEASTLKRAIERTIDYWALPCDAYEAKYGVSCQETPAVFLPPILAAAGVTAAAPDAEGES